MMLTSPEASISPLQQRQNHSVDVKHPPPPPHPTPPSSSETHPVLDVINPDVTKKKREKKIV